MKDVYNCDGQVMFFGHDREVVAISTNHLEGKNNNDVKHLQISNQPLLKVVPRNIYKFFPNLEGIAFYVTGITNVFSVDLQGLHSLRLFNVYANQITEIGNDLFKDNSLLETISFGNNPIRNVAPRVLDHLTSLTTVHLMSTSCIDVYFYYDRKAVEKLLLDLPLKCPPTFEMIETRILEGPSFKHLVEQEVALLTEKAIASCNARVAALEQQHVKPCNK